MTKFMHNLAKVSPENIYRPTCPQESAQVDLPQVVSVYWGVWKMVLFAVAITAFACKTVQKPFPTSGQEHPFYKSVKAVNTNPKSKGMSSPAPQAEFSEAKVVKNYDATTKLNDSEISFELVATPEVPQAAIKYLEKNLTATYVNTKKRPDLEPFLSKPGKLMHGQPEVRLPQLYGQHGEALFITWPDGWDLVRPYIIRLRPNYVPMAEPNENDGEIGVSRLALTGSWHGVQGKLQSRAPAESAQDLGFVEVTINGVTVHADDTGAFMIPGDFTTVDRLTVRYSGRINPVTGMEIGPRMSVMNDFHNPRSETVNISAGTTNDGILDVGTLVLTSLDAELFELGTDVLDAYHQLTGRFPPAADGFRIKRWAGVVSGTPYSYYDYVVIALNFRDDYTSRRARFSTLVHEFGHTLRHAADGDLGHWGWDNFRWAYARNHDGTEVFNEQYAFNEGWSDYWECTIGSLAWRCTTTFSGVPGAGFMDWNERLIANRLSAMASAPGVGHPAMVEILRDNPGTIHTLWDFEQRYCERFPSSGAFCTGGRPIRAKASCPPGYIDDGATCRLNNILAKESYGRGVGTIPNGCGSAENDAGLCYQPCRDGFDGVGPVCWRRCPPGMHDDGAFCRRDVQIISANNSSCPWYDLCGLTFARGCSTCPTGFMNDGCTCRIDAWIFAKESYGRGVGRLPTDCGPGRVYDAGLCYPRCRAGFTGVGPVCWGRCPTGYDDHGATCYRPPNVLVKY